MVVAKLWKLKQIQLAVEAKEQAEQDAAKKVLASFNVLNAFRNKAYSSSFRYKSLGSAVSDEAHQEAQRVVDAAPAPDANTPSVKRWRDLKPRLNTQAVSSLSQPDGAGEAPDQSRLITPGNRGDGVSTDTAGTVPRLSTAFLFLFLGSRSGRCKFRGCRYRCNV